MNANIYIDKESENRLLSTLRKGLEDAVGNTMYALTGDIKRLYDRHTPKLTGELRKNTELGVVHNGASAYSYIRYKQPYAHYQYVNHFINYTTPNTDGEWDRYSHEEVKELIHNELIKQIKKQFG